MVTDIKLFQFLIGSIVVLITVIVKIRVIVVVASQPVQPGSLPSQPASQLANLGGAG